MEAARLDPAQLAGAGAALASATCCTHLVHHALPVDCRLALKLLADHHNLHVPPVALRGWKGERRQRRRLGGGARQAPAACGASAPPAGAASAPTCMSSTCTISAFRAAWILPRICRLRVDGAQLWRQG